MKEGPCDACVASGVRVRGRGILNDDDNDLKESIWKNAVVR